MARQGQRRREGVETGTPGLQPSPPGLRLPWEVRLCEKLPGLLLTPFQKTLEGRRLVVSKERNNCPAPGPDSPPRGSGRVARGGAGPRPGGLRASGSPGLGVASGGRGPACAAGGRRGSAGWAPLERLVGRRGGTASPPLPVARGADPPACPQAQGPLPGGAPRPRGHAARGAPSSPRPAVGRGGTPPTPRKRPLLARVEQERLARTAAFPPCPHSWGA